MNNAQRVILATYPVFTGLILLSEYYSEPNFAAYLKIAVMLALTISVVWLAKVCDEQKVMALAFIFMALGDFFFVIPPTRDDMLIPYGIAGFLAAYLCLIVAFRKNASFGLAEIIIALPILAVLLYLAAILLPYLTLPLFIGTVLFAAMLCYMTWTAICTLPRGYFSTKTAWFIALGACLIFASDIRLAYEVFYPLLDNRLMIEASCFVRGPFVAGWVLLAVASAEDQPLMISRLGKGAKTRKI